MQEPFDIHAMEDLWIQIPRDLAVSDYLSSLYENSKCFVCHEYIDTVRGASMYNLIREHCKSAHHKERVASVRRMQDQVKNTLNIVHSTRSLFRVPRLHSEQWQDKVFAMFFRGMFFKNHDTTTESVESVLAHYELMEHVSFLGLAVWKAACLEDMPESTKGLIQVMAWYRGGWKTKKEEKRRCSAIGVVVGVVLPFLKK